MLACKYVGGCPGVPVHEGISFVFLTIHGVMTQFVNVSFLCVPVHEDTTICWALLFIYSVYLGPPSKAVVTSEVSFQYGDLSSVFKIFESFFCVIWFITITAKNERNENKNCIPLTTMVGLTDPSLQTKEVSISSSSKTLFFSLFFLEGNFVSSAQFVFLFFAVSFKWKWDWDKNKTLDGRKQGISTKTKRWK